MKIKLMGKMWEFRFVPNLGTMGHCDRPDLKNKTIKINSQLKDEMELDTIIHEMLHACNWHLDEEFVTECSNDMARVLYRLGYRKNES